MKKILYPILGIVLGLAFAFGWYQFNTMSVVENFVPYQPVFKDADEIAAEASAKKPSVFVSNGETHDFGLMKSAGTYEHEYVIKNSGNAPLEIRLGAISDDSGMVVSIKDGDVLEISPGQTQTISVTCTPTDGKAEFSGNVILKTNDPEKAELTLSLSGRSE